MSQEYAKSYDQLLDSEVRLVAEGSVGSNGHGSRETIDTDTDTGNQKSSIGPSSATAKHLTNKVPSDGSVRLFM